MQLYLASEFAKSHPKICAAIEQRDVRGKKAVFIPTAAFGEDYEPSAADTTDPLVNLGMSVQTFDLRGKSPAETNAALGDAAVISVGGGNTFFLLEHMRRSGFAARICGYLKQGCIYIGSSAGSIVCTPDINYIEGMDDPNRAVLNGTAGLDLVPFSLIPHLDHPFLADRAASRCAHYSAPAPVIALRDAQYLDIQNGVVRIEE